MTMSTDAICSKGVSCSKEIQATITTTAIEDKSVCAAPGPAVFLCPECGDCLSSQGYLDKHIQDSHVQSPQGRVECSYCPYTSNWRSRLTSHERTHTGERPFICQLCRKGFTEKGSLRTHLRGVHAKDKPHECEVCTQRFTKASDLYQHRRVQHTRESPWFACPHCGKGFTHRGNLNKHLRTHTGERPHACDTCAMRFANLSNMHKHRRVVHNRQYPHRCPHCRKGLSSVHNLRRHLRAQHRGEGEGADGESVQ